MGDIIKSLKEFIWDIIGYMIPGFFLMIMLNFFLIPGAKVERLFFVAWSEFNVSYIVIVLSYISGFVVYGLTLLKISIQDYFIKVLMKLNFMKFLRQFHSESWQDKFANSESLNNARQQLISDGYSNLPQMKINEIRNILMSKFPEMDQKVYTFMFRSAVFDYISTVFLLIFFLFMVQLFVGGCKVKFLITGEEYTLMYLLFFILSGLLGRGKRRFFSKAQRIPFSKLK